MLEERTGEPVELVPGKVGQFDVERDGRLLFSKGQAGRFPTAEDIPDPSP